jgi:hypothetical protein
MDQDPVEDGALRMTGTIDSCQSRSDMGPAIDVYEAVAYTAPGIIAHQSALAGGKPLKVPVFDSL